MSTNSKLKSGKLQSAIHLALGLSAGALALSVVPNVFAQDPAEQDEEIEFTEEVIVTGSRIKRADIDSASPVTVIDRDSIMATGLTDIGRLIQSMPSMTGSPRNTATNNGGDGAVLIDLRGMGVNRTLTLINGQRTVDGGDFQTIPSSMIERVEILKDGASAVYGADAVAGVVNIITRRNFQGIEFTAQTSDWFDSKGKEETIGLIAGAEFAGGNIVFGAEYVNQELAFQSDLPWDFFQNAYYIYPEGCENQVAAPYDFAAGGSVSGCFPVGSSRIPQTRITFFSQGLFMIGTPATEPYEVGLMVPHDDHTYNFSPVNYMQTPFERTNIFAEAHFDLTDNVRFNAEVRGNFRTSDQEAAPLPFTDSDPMYDGFYLDPATGETVAFHGISPDNYYLRRAVDAYNAANGASFVYEPVAPRRRMIESTRHSSQRITQYQVIAGLEGSFNDVDWDIYINEGYRSRSDQDSGQFAGARLFNAMGPSADLDGDGQPECYADLNDPGTLIVGCVPLNFFGGGEVDPVTSQPVVTTITQDMLDYVSVTATDTFNIKQRSVGANLTGSNFELPGGEIGWAVGWSYWKQNYKYSPDSNKVLGALTGNVGAGTNGSLTNNAFYIEFLAPLYDNGTQNLYLKGGLRYDDWNQFSNDETYQLGLEFQAIDSVKLRATYGTVFRAPTITELFGGEVDSFPTYADPCTPVGTSTIAPGCDRVAPQFDNQLHARVGGNSNLIPETGDTLTAGIVWTPQIGNSNVSVTVDYWEIAFDDGISSLGAQFILDNCYRDLNQDACDLITRRADYSIDVLLDSNLNVASQGGKGYDTEVRWNYDSSVGQWQASFLWSHLLERTKTPFEGAEEDELSGRYTDDSIVDQGGYPKDKISYSLQWMMNDFTIGYLGEYISGLDAQTFCNCGAGNQPDGSYIQDINSELYHDVVASYVFNTFGSNITVSGGITNITDEPPPFIEIGFNASTSRALHRIFGRGYYLRLAWKY